MSTSIKSAAPRPRRTAWIEDAERVDLTIYAAIARTPPPALDSALIGTALGQLTTHLARDRWPP
jgi:hypothetical protein